MTLAQRIALLVQLGEYLVSENELLVVLDGFDEIPSNDKLYAIREIEYFIDKYKAIHVIVSCRNNFYNIETETSTGLLDKFNSCKFDNSQTL
mgnify:CR=1 FL=1